MSPISEDDLDRLADYTAGVLDPQQAAEVDRLIAGAKPFDVGGPSPEAPAAKGWRVV